MLLVFLLHPQPLADPAYLSCGQSLCSWPIQMADSCFCFLFSFTHCKALLNACILLGFPGKSVAPQILKSSVSLPNKGYCISPALHLLFLMILDGGQRKILYEYVWISLMSRFIGDSGHCATCRKFIKIFVILISIIRQKITCLCGSSSQKGLRLFEILSSCFETSLEMGF